MAASLKNLHNSGRSDRSEPLAGRGHIGIEGDDVVEACQAKDFLHEPCGAGNRGVAALLGDLSEAISNGADAGAVNIVDMREIEDELAHTFLKSFQNDGFDPAALLAERQAAAEDDGGDSRLGRVRLKAKSH